MWIELRGREEEKETEEEKSEPVDKLIGIR